MRGGLDVVVVTGLSGSGKSTAIHALEDLGYFCIDNLPAALIPRFMELCEGRDEIVRVALGVDSRTRGFLEELEPALGEVRGRGHRVAVAYLESSDEVLLRRFGETRRPHPLAEGSDVASGIRREREMLAALRARADRIIDTTALTAKQLRDEVRSSFAPGGATGALRLALVSFGFKYGIPAEADLVWDARFLPNPFWIPALRSRNGLDEEVRRYVLSEASSRRFLRLVLEYLRFSLPRYREEGKTYLTATVGCTGGRHRSVVIVERLAAELSEPGVEVSIRHRDIER